MKKQVKEVFQNSFYQLLVVYAIFVALISFSLLKKYTLHFEVLAILLAVIGISILSKKGSKEIKLNKKLHYVLIILAVILIILFRVIPYIGNSIPLGYDSGIYKYGIESGLANLDEWVLSGGMEPGFLYLMQPFVWIFSSQFILTYLLIAFCILLGFAIYLVAREYFGKDVALISILIYAISSVQFLTFEYMYYKNIIGLSLALFSIYFLKRSEKDKNSIWWFVLLGGLIGAVHRPTFFIFGLSYFFYAFISPLKNKKYSWNILKKNVLYGIIILAIAIAFYLGKFRPAILNMLSPVAQSFISPGSSSGTFISLFTYQFSTLIYLPFALIGLFALCKQRKFNMLFFWTLITGIIVYFQFFFFNRFIINLDIMLILLAGLGFSIIIKQRKKLGIILLCLLLIAGGFVMFNTSQDAGMRISQENFNLVQGLNALPPDAHIMSLSSEYSPWILGYSNREIIAPGLFDNNKWSQEEWNLFWNTQDKNTTIELMNSYLGKEPIYLFTGIKEFNNSCFQTYKEGIYRYDC
jgi:dolichyl-phosphate-mannose-protein mannosyltransferase